MGNEERKNSFFKLVLSIKNEIEKFDLQKWETIVRPEDPGYDAYFNKCVEDQKKEWESGENREMETREKKTFDLNATYFERLSRNEKFFFLLNLKEMMETSWLLAHKRLAGIKSEEESNSLRVDDIIRYSSTLADTTYAPPDYDNVEDKALHLQFYPNYHFLNFINIEKIHMSKLFQLQKYNTVCFPPIIYLKEKEEGMLTIYIFCTTPNATIYYKVNNDVHERIYDRKHKPNIPKSGKVVIYARSTKEGFLNSRVSYYSKTYKGKGASEKDVLVKPLPMAPPQMLSKEEISEESSTKPTLDKSKKVFKTLGFLLNREREKKSKSSSSESSSDDT